MTRRSVMLAVVLVGLGGCSPTASRPSSEPASGIPRIVQCKTTSASFERVQTITWGPDALVETAPTPATQDGPTSTVITVLGEPLLSIDVTVDDASKRHMAVARTGKAFSGMREMMLVTVDGGETFEGTIDGKKLKPFVKNTSPQAFADGSPLPAVSIDARAQQELTAFFKSVYEAPDACAQRTASASSLLFAGAVQGHAYQPDFAPLCATCLGGCITLTSAAVALAINACQLSAYAVGACITVGILSAFLIGRVCRSTCLTRRPGPCCPTDCQVDGVCCDTTDSCLTTANHGLCCPSDHPQACGGKQCCLAGDVCNPLSGDCCPAGASPCGSCGASSQPCCDGRCLAGNGCQQGTCVTCPTTSAIRSLGGTASQFAGNNCFPVDFTRTYGTRCDAGFQRDQCTATVIHTNDSRAFCRATWQDQSDPTNCKCEVHFQTPSDCNGGIECSVQVTEIQSGASPLPQGCPRP